MVDPKWSDDAFLDMLKAQGDERADHTLPVRPKSSKDVPSPLRSQRRR